VNIRPESSERAASIDLNPDLGFATITPAMIEKEHSRVGHELKRNPPFIEMASLDAIRHWVQGIGDRNPLWQDEGYARQSRWGDVIAPPSLVLALAPHGSSGFRGVHGWHMGISIEMHDEPISRNQVFDTYSILESIKEVHSAYVGRRTWDQTYRTDLLDRDSRQLVAVLRSSTRRFERNEGRKIAKYGKRVRQTYSEDQLRDIATAILAETPRGADPRFVEDVAVGDSLGEIKRGPLTSNDCIAFVRGWGGAYVMANGNMWEFVRKHPGAFPLDDSGVPDSPERTHWSDKFAQAVGAPAAFDYGPQRESWCCTLLTNWMGDDAIVRSFSARVLLPNYHGDLVCLSGEVAAVDLAASRVEVTFGGRNQLGETVVDGTGSIELLSRARDQSVSSKEKSA
jgi:hypothetical protein